eukprot:TRINITY_DN5057_c0_g1_i1.p2 TRINITY_DN5057_c0_g1~~TRINITY_DN5057_c0_g1_i1.p2  ORF type:complete len:109 (-),score=9.25 TRINITY_DN5057_c0_g1_i1:41-367(-)
MPYTNIEKIPLLLDPINRFLKSPNINLLTDLQSNFFLCQRSIFSFYSGIAGRSIRQQYPMYSALIPVSYTHLTLPTICSVQISVVAVSLKKKKNNKQVQHPCTIIRPT